MKIKIYILFIISVLALTSCLVDSSWLNIVGRWQDEEVPSFEIEFTDDGKYAEYLYGDVVGYGDFSARNNTITITYSSPCGGENQGSCVVTLDFSVTDDSLIITDNEGDIQFNKVSASE